MKNLKVSLMFLIPFIFITKSNMNNSFILILFSLVICLFFSVVYYLSVSDCFISKRLGFSDNDYYEDYLNLIINTLDVCDKSFYEIKRIDKDNIEYVDGYIDTIYGCYNYLLNVKPPSKYKDYHIQILYNLAEIIDTKNEQINKMELQN